MILFEKSLSLSSYQAYFSYEEKLHVYDPVIPTMVSERYHASAYHSDDEDLSDFDSDSEELISDSLPQPKLSFFDVLEYAIAKKNSLNDLVFGSFGDSLPSVSDPITPFKPEFDGSTIKIGEIECCFVTANRSGNLISRTFKQSNNGSSSISEQQLFPEVEDEEGTIDLQFDAADLPVSVINEESKIITTEHHQDPPSPVTPLHFSATPRRLRFLATPRHLRSPPSPFSFIRVSPFVANQKSCFVSMLPDSSAFCDSLRSISFFDSAVTGYWSEILDLVREVRSGSRKRFIFFYQKRLPFVDHVLGDPVKNAFDSVINNGDKIAIQVFADSKTKTSCLDLKNGVSDLHSAVITTFDPGGSPTNTAVAVTSHNWFVDHPSVWIVIFDPGGNLSAAARHHISLLSDLRICASLQKLPEHSALLSSEKVPEATQYCARRTYEMAPTTLGFHRLWARPCYLGY